MINDCTKTGCYLHEPGTPERSACEGACRLEQAERELDAHCKRYMTAYMLAWKEAFTLDSAAKNEVARG